MPGPGKYSSWRRWLFWLLIITFVWVVLSHLTEIETLAQTLATGRWQWVAAAALLQLLYFLVFTALYQSAFATVGVSSRLRDLLPITFASIFINSTAPSGGVAGTALFVDDARRRGQSAAQATAGTFLALVADYGAFAAVLLMGLLILMRRKELTTLEASTAAILFLFAGGMAVLLTLGLWRPPLLRRLLDWFQGMANRLGRWFKRPLPLPADWAEKNTAEFTAAATAIANRPGYLLRTLTVALAAHLLDIASLYCLFLAFRQPVSGGVLVTLYAMTVLFWIVSPTPNGIGVVEVVMPAIYASLGVPVATGAIISLAFRGLTFWIPLFIGFVLLQRLRMFSSPERALAEAGQVRLAAVLTAGMGLINLLSALTPALAERMHLLVRFSPLAVRQGGHLTAVLSGFALLILAQGLWRGKRMAWLLTLAALLLSIVSHLIKGLDYEEALLAALLAVFLWSQRSHFQALSDPPSIRRGVATVGAALLFTLVYGTLGFYLLDRHYSVNFGLAAALRQTVVMFTAFYDPGLQPLTGFGRYFAASIYIVGAVTLGYGLFMLLRPVLLRAPATAAERERARQIVEGYGRSSLARMALFPDKSYYFSQGGSVIAYAAKGRAAVSLGDPIGPAEDAAAAIHAFTAYCRHHDWQPAFYQVLPDYLSAYQAAGFTALPIGSEGIVNLNTLTLEGKAGKPLRNALNRFGKLGYQAAVHPPPLPDNLLAELQSVSNEWLASIHGQEKRFSLGWFDKAYIRGCAVMVVSAANGSVTAFANIVPEYQHNEVTIDLMRHRQNIENGTMDFLFVSLFQWAKGQGYDSFNLGLSPLSGVGEQPEDPAVEKALHFIYEHVNQFYNFKGLHEFKGKFHPDWSPRFFIFPGPASLPAVATTLNRASSGDAFILDYLKGLFSRFTIVLF